MKTFLQFLESVATDPRIGGHDPEHPFKSRFNATHGNYEVVDTGRNCVLSLHTTEADALIGISKIQEVSPPGWRGTTEAMKKHKDITNPWALAWWMKNKGYKSHQKDPNAK